eukprot:329107-Chlamydomonas_euryale.AAC.25
MADATPNPPFWLLPVAVGNRCKQPMAQAARVRIESRTCCCGVLVSLQGAVGCRINCQGRASGIILAVPSPLPFPSHPHPLVPFRLPLPSASMHLCGIFT